MDRFVKLFAGEAERIRLKLGQVTTGHEITAVSMATGMLAGDLLAAVSAEGDDPHADLEEHLATFFELVRGAARVELARLRNEPIPEDLL